MGGKAAMALALTRPETVRRLLVADIAPVAYTHSHSHFIDAMRGLDLAGIDKRSAADHALSGAIPEAGVRAFLLQSLDLKGRKWRFNLDVLQAEMPRITGFPAFSTRFENPVLFLSGGASDYVQPGHRPVIKTLFPKARFARIPGVGHWLHAEKPREFEDTARLFLDS
jgi:pimeloyl-ACP methyl ester carboxylesterase